MGRWHSTRGRLGGLALSACVLATACGDDSAGSAPGRDAGDAAPIGADGSPMPVRDAPGQERAAEQPPTMDAAAHEAAAADAPWPVDTPVIDASIADVPLTSDGERSEASPIDGWSFLDGGTPSTGSCPQDQIPDWDALPAADALAQAPVAATQLTPLPYLCTRCAPQVAVDEASLLYVLGHEGAIPGAKGSLAVSSDGGKSFQAIPGQYLPFDSVGTSVRIAAGGPGRVFAVTSSSGCATLLASWDAGQSWPLRKSLMPSQADLHVVALGRKLAVASVTSGDGTLAVSQDEGASFVLTSLATDGALRLLADRATGALYVLTLSKGAVTLWPWDFPTGALRAPVVTALPVDTTLFAMSAGVLVGVSPDGAAVHRTSLTAPQAVASLGVPAGAAVKAVHGDAGGNFVLVAYWDQPDETSVNTSTRGYVAFHLSVSVNTLGLATPVHLARVPTATAYLSVGTGADIVAISSHLAFVADGFGIAHIGVSHEGRVIDWRLPPDPFPTTVDGGT